MAFEKNWRDRKIVHRTPGGKMTRVKISSLPADEQQKYNPNRYKRGADTKMSPEDYAELQKKEVDAGHIFDFYIQLGDVAELDDIEEGTLVLATTDSSKVRDLFDDDMKVIKLKKVPMDAVKKAVIPSEDGEPLDLENSDSIPFEELGDLEGRERYEKIKFNDEQLYQLDIAPYMEFIEIIVDEPESNEDEGDEGLTEGFFNYYSILGE